MTDLVKALDTYRQANKVTYKELADRLDTSKDIIYDTINNRRRFIDLHLLQRINKLLQEG